MGEGRVSGFIINIIVYNHTRGSLVAYINIWGASVYKKVVRGGSEQDSLQVSFTIVIPELLIKDYRYSVC